MAFAKTFLPNYVAPEADNNTDADIARIIDVLMEAVAPGPVLSSAHRALKASNLNFGVPMSWALSEAQRKERVASMLREVVITFDPRISSLGAVSIFEDSDNNQVHFRLNCLVGQKGNAHRTEVETALSLFDQQVDNQV